MKQKVFKLLLPFAIASLILAGCGGQNQQEPGGNEPGEQEPGGGGQEPGGQETNSYTIKFVNDDGTVLQEGKVDEGVLPVYTGATPEKAATSQYTYTFDKWVPDVVAAVADATYTASYTSEAVYHPDPTITITGEKTLNVNAGESIALPTVTAADHTGKALQVEFEDDFGGSSIQNGQFTSKVAGTHNVIFYAEDEFGGIATDTVVVNVAPANAETNEVTAAENDPTNITNYGTYKENFAKGTNSPYFKSLGDARNSAEISATSDAIAGNSLVFNARLLLGDAGYCLFGKVINDVVRRGVQVTYTISFDYKAINSDGCFNGMYFSPSYDTPAGSAGKDTKLSPEVGVTKHFEETYSRFVFPATGNCYLRFFNYNASNPDVDSFIAVDNIVVTAKEEAQITYVTPTTEQLLADGGFTWNLSDASPDISNTTFMALSEVENAAAKEAMEASDLFGANVIHLKGQADHNMKSLNSTNVVVDKILEVSFWYYAVTDLAHVIFMGCNGSNPTITGDNLVREVVDGNIKKITAKLHITSYAGTDVVNFYGGGASDEIYIGKLTAKLYDYVAPQEVIDKPDAHIPTMAELAAGYTWDMVDNFIDFDNSEYVDVANMEDATIKAAIQGNSAYGSKVLRFKGGLMCLGVGAANLTPGYVLTVDIDYYCVADSFQHFILRGATDGDNVTQVGSTWSRTTVEGNFKHFHFEGVMPNSLRDTTMTTYNGEVNMLITKVTISCTEPAAPAFENHVATAAELAVGFTWTPGTESSHPGFDSGCETVKVADIADADLKAALQGNSDVGNYVQHVNVNGGGNAKFQGLIPSNVPDGKKLTVEIFYYAVTDYQYFLLKGSHQTGERTSETISGNFKKHKIVWSPTSGFDYISMYNNGEGYVYKITALLEDVSIPEDETPLGHKVGDVLNVYTSGSSFLGGTVKKDGENNTLVEVFDYANDIDSELVAHPALGSAPKKLTFTTNAANDGNIEISHPSGSLIEAGVTYKIKICLYNIDWTGAIFFRCDGQFIDMGNTGAAGYQELEVTYKMTASADYICIYTNSKPASGSFYIGNITAEITAVK